MRICIGAPGVRTDAVAAAERNSSKMIELMKAKLFVTLPLSLYLLPASGARALCLTPELRLLWTYPSEGEQDVPTNAVFWALLNTAYGGIRPVVTVDGHPLSVSASAEAKRSSGVSPVSYGGQIDIDDLRADPGPLAPNAPHTLSLTYKPTSDSPESVFEVHFTTGAGPNERVIRKPRVVGYSEYAVQDAAIIGCPSLVQAQGCFDTVEAIPIRITSFEVEPDSALAWFVRTDRPDGSMLWPTSCGAPSLAVRESRGDECFEIQAVAKGGRLSPATRFCANEQARGKILKARAKGEQASRLSQRSNSDLVPIEPVRVRAQPQLVDAAQKAERTLVDERVDNQVLPAEPPAAPAADDACNSAKTSPRTSCLSALLVALAVALARRRQRSG